MIPKGRGRLENISNSKMSNFLRPLSMTYYWNIRRSVQLLIFICICLILPCSSSASRRKLHSCLGSCIPTLYHCDHRCVASDYIPTLRLLCHSERLREAANIKRRQVNMNFLLSSCVKRLGRGTVPKFGWACVARFHKPLPHFRSKYAIFPTLFWT